MSFDRALTAVLKMEGGYSNNPKDPGGETFCGISRRFWPAWPGWVLVDRALRRGEPLMAVPGLSALVRQFYLTEFWVPLRCPEIDGTSPEIAEELFEASVNTGRSNGVKFLQRALDVLSAGKLYPLLSHDGIIGQKTMTAVMICLRQRGPRMLEDCQNGEQYIYYKGWSGHKDFPGVFRRISPGMFNRAD